MRKAYPLTRLTQIEALTSPARGEIVDVVDLLGPSSIAQIAEVVGKPADSLYYHVRKLLKAGLLIEVERRKAVRQSEAVYDLPGRPMYLEYQPSQSSFITALVRSINGMLRLAGRDFKAAFSKHLVHGTGRRRNVVHSRALGWLSDEEAVEMRRQIEEVIVRFRSSVRNRKSDEHLYAMTTILIPLEEKRSRRAG